MRIPVKSNAYDIPRRLAEIDPSLQVFFNTDRQCYEVFGRDLRGPYLMASFAELDCRVETAIYKAYNAAHNTGRPYKHLLRQQEIEDAKAEERRLKDLADLEYGFKDDLKYMGKPVISGESLR